MTRGRMLQDTLDSEDRTKDQPTIQDTRTTGPLATPEVIILQHCRRAIKSGFVWLTADNGATAILYTVAQTGVIVPVNYLCCQPLISLLFHAIRFSFCLDSHLTKEHSKPVITSPSISWRNYRGISWQQMTKQMKNES